MKLSIVTSIYQSSNHIKDFYERVTYIAKNLASTSYEIIFVDDGSTDNSLSLAIQIGKKDSHVVVIELSRNFGHHKALITGLSHAKGDRVFLIDSDLEENPEWLINFNQLMNEKKCDVVFGVQRKRKGLFFEKISGGFFYIIIRFFSGLELPKNPTVARLMTKQYVLALINFRETDLYIGGIMHLAGFTQISMSVDKGFKGLTTYSTTKKITAAIDAIISLTSLPLMYLFYLGFGISLSAFAYAIYTIVNYFIYNQSIAGWSSLIISIWLLGGLLIFSVGLLGLYISKIFNQTKNRPYSIIKNIHCKSSKK